MTHPERSAKISHSRPDASIRARAFRRPTAAPRALPALLAAAAVLLSALLAGGALADGRIGEHGDGTGAAGQLSLPFGIAVSRKEGGDVYVLDASNDQRVGRYTPAGAWAGAFGWSIVPGAAAGTGNLELGSTSVTNVNTTLGAFDSGNWPIATNRTGGGAVIAAPGFLPPNTVVETANSSELKLSNPAEATGTNVPLTMAAGPGNVPTNELQRLTVRATVGQFKLSFKSPNPGSTTLTTAALNYNAGAAEVQSALAALANVGSGNVAVSGGPGDAAGTSPYLIEFKGRYADTNVEQLGATELGLGGGSPTTAATLATPRQGAGALETCSTVCTGEGAGENDQIGAGSEPGQLRWSDEIAIDNDPSTGSEYGDVYVVDQRNFRVEKYDPEGHFLLMFGGGVDQGPNHPGDVCTAAFIAEGDTCGVGVPGTGPAHFYSEANHLHCSEVSGEASWSCTGHNSIAVGPGGRVYVGDYGRVQEFEPGGSFAGELNLPDSEPQFVIALAVDAAGNIFERSAITDERGKVKHQVPGVREYDSSHSFLRSFDTAPGSEPTHIALDEEGHLFVSDLNGSTANPPTGEFQFRGYLPNGTLYAEFTSDQIKAPGGLPRGLAVGDAAGKLYASSQNTQVNDPYVAVIPLPVIGPPIAGGEEATDIEPETVTLHGTVNPSGFDTSYHFEYLTQQHYLENGNTFAGAESAPLPPPYPDLGLVVREDRVQTPISGLALDTAYRYRVVAESECEPVAHPGHICVTEGPGSEFRTLPAVSVRDLTTQTVGPELVKFKAQLSPNNGTATHYKVCIGEEEGNYPRCSPEGTLAAVGNDFEEVTATFEGLRPDTEYHYVLIAHNSYGVQVETPDAAFTTEESLSEQDAAQGCGNAQLRQENRSLALPDCRAYEQTTPVNKEGGEAFSDFALAPDGERVLYRSEGSFAGSVLNEFATQYIAHRTGAGWVTQAVVGAPAPTGYEPGSASEFSAGLDRWLFPEQPGLSATAAHGAGSSGFYSLGEADGSFVSNWTPDLSLVEGPPRVFYSIFRVKAASADLSQLFILTGSRLLPAPGDQRPDDPIGNPTRLYEIAGAGSPNPTLSLAAEVPAELTDDSCRLLDKEVGSEGHPGDAESKKTGLVASSDGNTLFYTVPVQKAAGQPCGEGKPNPVGLFARIDGAAPIQLNAPQPSQCSAPSPCASAATTTPVYYGTTATGSLAWFSTRQPLIGSDTDPSRDLYLAKLENGELTELVQATGGGPGDPTPGADADVQGFVRLSQDGSTASFVARGVLTTTPNGLGEEAAQGADNLYVYSATSAQTRFVARLCSGPEESGSVADSACPEDLSSTEGADAANNNDDHLWLYGANRTEARLTPDGRYLLFASWGRLAPGDTDNVRDVYRYDLQTGWLTRLSFGRNGNDANGNDDLYSATMPGNTATDWQLYQAAEDESRAISADGSIAIFTTSAPLVSADTNAAPDVYEWEEGGHGSCHEAGGCVSLVSDGLDPQGARNGLIGSGGTDITFQTRRGLAPGDTDGVGDVYDARENGGFPFVPPHRVCDGGETAEACGRSAGVEPAAPNLATPNFVGSGNGPEKLHCGKGRHRVTKRGQPRCVPNKRHKQRKRHKNHHRAANSNRGGAR